MPLPVVRSGVFYWKNRKAGATNKVTARFNHARTKVVFAEDLAWSKGLSSVELVINEIIPVSGELTCHKDLEQILAQEDIDAMFLIGGKQIRPPNKWAVTENTMESDAETGVCNGTLTLAAGRPKLIG